MYREFVLCKARNAYKVDKRHSSEFQKKNTK